MLSRFVRIKLRGSDLREDCSSYDTRRCLIGSKLLLLYVARATIIVNLDLQYAKIY